MGKIVGEFCGGRLYCVCVFFFKQTILTEVKLQFGTTTILYHNDDAKDGEKVMRQVGSKFPKPNISLITATVQGATCLFVNST